MNIPVLKSPHQLVVSTLVGLFFLQCGYNHDVGVEGTPCSKEREAAAYETCVPDTVPLLFRGAEERRTSRLKGNPDEREGNATFPEGGAGKSSALWRDYYRCGRLDSCERILIRRAEELIRVSPYHPELQRIYHDLGLVYYHKEDYYYSIYHFLLSIKLIVCCEPFDHQYSGIATLLQRITLCLYKLEDYRNAKQIFCLLQQVAHSAEGQKVDLYDPCLESIPSSSSHGEDLLQRSFRRCTVSLKCKDRREAQNAWKVFSDLMEREPPPEPLWRIRYHHLAAAYYQYEGCSLKAIAHYRKANAINKNGFDNKPLYATYYVDALFNLATLNVSLFHTMADPWVLREALRTYREAIKKAAIPLSEIKEDKSRMIYNERLYRYYKEYTSFLLSLYASSSAHQKASFLLDEVISISELCKYSAVRNRVSQDHNIRATQKYIHRFLQKVNRDPSSIPEAIKEVPFLNHAYVRRKREGNAGEKAPFSLSSIQEELGDKEIIINYLLSSDSVYCNVITKDTLSLIPIGAVAAVEEALQHGLVSIKKLQPKHKLSESMTALSALLMHPLVAYMDSVCTIYVVHEGVTSHIPFDCLQIDGEYLIEHYTIHELLYLSDWKRSVFSVTPPPSFMAFAPSATLSKGERVPPLGFSKVEVEQCARFLEERGWHCHTYLNGEATIMNFQDALTSGGMLHLSGHLYAPKQENHYPYFLLNEGGIPLRYYQWNIVSQGIKVKHLVLSTCDSGCGPYYDSEGVDSFVRSFHYSGVEHIIYTRWELEDRFASFFFPLYYQYLLETASPSEALQKAKIRCIQSPNYAHPFYWGAINGI